MSEKRKTKFMWASIAGAQPEPVEVTVIDGRKAVFTLGCPDPFFLDDKSGIVRLGGVHESYGGRPLCMDFRSREPMERPVLPDSDSKREIKEKYESARLAKMPRHSWRGPR